MGMFSMYTGLIYNDVFGKSINVFGSHWNVTQPVADMMDNKYMELDPNHNYVDSPYPIGLDPVWQVSDCNFSFVLRESEMMSN